MKKSIKKTIDINCDMGESFGPWRISSMSDEAILKSVSSANIAAGFHAGDPNHMNTIIGLAKKYGVCVGAHIGYNDLQGFGRRHVDATDQELVNDMIYQIGAVREFCKLYGIALTHIKPHGALYMKIADHAQLASLLLKTLAIIAPKEPLFCMGNTEVYAQGLRQGHPMAREFFADRDYNDNGQIVFVRKVDAPDPDKIKRKLILALAEEKVETVSGKTIDLPFESICFHSDTPGCDVVAACITEVMQKLHIKRRACSL